MLLTKIHCVIDIGKLLNNTTRGQKLHRLPFNNKGLQLMIIVIINHEF